MKQESQSRKFEKGERALYENVFDGLSYYPTVGETYHLNRSKQKVQKFYLEAIKNIEAPKILDIGCYIGTDLFMLPKPNEKAKYWGVDVSKDAIYYAKQLVQKRGEKNIYFKVSDANKQFPFPKNYFDVITALELIEHLHDPNKFLKEIKRLLKPGGVLIISTPNGDRITNKMIDHLPKWLSSIYQANREKDFTRHGVSFHLNSDIWDNDAHISLFGFAKWKNIFNKASFILEKVDGSAIFAGNRFIGDRPGLLGFTLLLDSFFDKLPLKPHFQMCLILKLRKNEK